jgi:hypothetical protein
MSSIIDLVKYVKGNNCQRQILDNLAVNDQSRVSGFGNKGGGCGLFNNCWWLSAIGGGRNDVGPWSQKVSSFL